MIALGRVAHALPLRWVMGTPPGWVGAVLTRGLICVCMCWWGWVQNGCMTEEQTGPTPAGVVVQVPPRGYFPDTPPGGVDIGPSGLGDGRPLRTYDGLTREEYVARLFDVPVELLTWGGGR